MRVVGLLAFVIVAGCSSSSGGDGVDGGSSSSSGSSSGGSSGCPSACDPGSVCVNDGTGNMVCAQSCTRSALGTMKTGSTCPSAKDCCAIPLNSTLPAGEGACFAPGSFTGQECLCKSVDDCSQEVCGPITDSSGNPVGPYICKPIDGKAYDGCSGAGGTCADGLCCISAQGGLGSDAGDMGYLGYLCFEPCQTSANCGGAQCLPSSLMSCNGSANVCDVLP